MNFCLKLYLALHDWNVRTMGNYYYPGRLSRITSVVPSYPAAKQSHKFLCVKHNDQRASSGLLLHAEHTRCKANPSVYCYAHKPSKLVTSYNRTPFIHSCRTYLYMDPLSLDSYLYYWFLWLCWLCGWNLPFISSAPSTFTAHRSHHMPYIQNNVCTK